MVGQAAGRGPAPAGVGGGYRGGVADEQVISPGPAGASQAAGEPVVSSYPGEKFGLPESGPRSVSGMGRLLGALLIDWLLCVFIATALLHSQYWALALFAAEVYILTVLTGTTIGKRTSSASGWPGSPAGRWALGSGLVRTVLLLCRGAAAHHRP